MSGAHGTYNDRNRGARGANANGWRDECQFPQPSEIASERQKLLFQTIEGEIIPRLMLAHSMSSGQPAQPILLGAVVAAEDVTELASILIGYPASQACAFVDGLVAEGISVELIFLDLLAPAARELGELWKADRCDFTEVTLGLSRLHQVVRVLSDAFEGEGCEGEGCEAGSRALMATMPGDQHLFGIILVEEFLRRDGWTVWSLKPRVESEVLEAVSAQSFAMVGFSLGSELLVPRLTSLIASVRRASRNPAVHVMVGGPVFLDHPDWITEVGADATARDGREVAVQSRHLTGARATES